MKVLLYYLDLGAPSRYLRMLEAGVYHQVLADAGFEAVSRLLPADYQPSEVVDAYRTHAAGLTLFYVDEFNAPQTRAAIASLRTAFPDVPVAAAGPMTVLSPEAILASPHVDYIVIGEGEIALFELVTQLSRHAEPHGLKNVWVRRGGHVERAPLRPLLDNLDQLPSPHRSLIGQSSEALPTDEGLFHVAASRGCPQECLFCYSPLLKRAYEGRGKYYRFRSPQTVAAEIQAAAGQQRFRTAVFADEWFPPDKNWLRAFGQRMTASRIPFEVTASAEAWDDEALDLLRDAGCTRVNIGIETGSDPLRRRLSARNQSHEAVTAFVDRLRARAFGIRTWSMSGLPGETPEALQQTYELNQQLAPDDIRSTAFFPITGTPLEIATSSAMPRTGAEPRGFESIINVPENLTREVLQHHLHRMHFLAMLRALEHIPPASARYDLLRLLPKARYKLPSTRCLWLDRDPADAAANAFLAMEPGTECRFSIALFPASVFETSLRVGKSMLGELARRRTAVRMEVLWSREGQRRTLLSYRIQPDDTLLTATWIRISVPLPAEAGEQGELILRAAAESDEHTIRAYVLWGAPYVTDPAHAGSPVSKVIHDSAQNLPALLNEKQESLKSLSQELASQREALGRLQSERDDKARRVGELQIRILELEKALDTALEGLQQIKAEQAAPLAEKLKGLFRKS